MKLIIFLCILLGLLISATIPEEAIPVQLIIFRSNISETFYEDSIRDVAKDFPWKFENSTPTCTASSLYECACNELEKVTSSAKSRQMIIFVVEDLSDADAVCAYNSHKDSPLLLQIFHAEERGPDHAIIALNSPSGRIHYEIEQESFPEKIVNVFNIMNIDYNGSLLNPNTPPKPIIFNRKLMKSLLKERQDSFEAGKTPIGYVHLGFALIIIIVAFIIGFLSVDHQPFVEYDVIDPNDRGFNIADEDDNVNTFQKCSSV